MTDRDAAAATSSTRPEPGVRLAAGVVEAQPRRPRSGTGWGSGVWVNEGCGLDTLARQVGLSRLEVVSALDELVATGWLARVSPPRLWRCLVRGPVP